MKSRYPNMLDVTAQLEDPTPLASPTGPQPESRVPDKFLDLYHKQLYGSKLGSLTPEFEFNLRLLTVFAGAWLGFHSLLALLAYSAGQFSGSVLALLLMGILVCISLTVSLYAGVARYPAGLRVKLVMLYTIVVSSFFVFFDPSLLQFVTGWSTVGGLIPVPLLVIMFSVFMKKVLFDKFTGVLLYASYTQILYFVLQFSLSGAPASFIMYEGLTLVLLNVMAVLDAYSQEKSYKACFLKSLEESMNLDAPEPVEPELANRNVNTTIDSIHSLCRKIKLKISDASRGVMFSDMRALLRKTQQEIELIGKQISNGLYNTNLATVYRSGIDEEDRTFLSEYCNIQTTYQVAPAVNQRPERRRAATATLSADELEAVLSSLGRNWSFDVWFVHELSGNSILPVAHHLYKRLGLRQEVTEATFTRYFTLLEDSYKDNPYHNACHAADVAHSLFFFLDKGRVLNDLEGSDHLCLIIASLAHDVAHPGVTNRYLINSRHEIAMTYNDVSVLENMHASTTFQLMKQQNVLELCRELPRARKLILELILCTDMFRHFEVVSTFNTKAIVCNDLDPSNEADKTLLFCVGLKVADISHTAKYKILHEKWTKLISEEFFLQGDREKADGLPVSMYCDRETTNIAKSQAGFIKIICLPLFEAWCAYLKNPEVDTSCLQQLKKNLKTWENKLKTRRKTRRIEAFLEPVRGIQKLSSGNF